MHVAVLAALVDLGDDVLRAPLAARDEERPRDVHRVAEGLARAEEGNAPEGPEQHGRAQLLGVVAPSPSTGSIPPRSAFFVAAAHASIRQLLPPCLSG